MNGGPSSNNYRDYLEARHPRPMNSDDWRAWFQQRPRICGYPLLQQLYVTRKFAVTAGYHNFTARKGTEGVDSNMDIQIQGYAMLCYGSIYLIPLFSKSFPQAPKNKIA
jgi:hypothetical protein